jgi:hypothetical protein
MTPNARSSDVAQKNIELRLGSRRESSPKRPVGSLRRQRPNVKSRKIGANASATRNRDYEKSA